ncbi:MAG: hypothetical protein JWR08_62 [Enterovirga sp.]|nr:hypothetical protein [Enterovirga sp.]
MFNDPVTATATEAWEFSVRIGQTTMTAAQASPGSLRSAVDRANTERRLSLVPDRLNPDLLDKERVEILVSGLKDLPLATREQLTGKTLFLNDPSYGVVVPSPISIASLRRGFSLKTRPRPGRIADAEIEASVDCERAKLLADEALAALKGLDPQLDALEASLPNRSATEKAAALRTLGDLKRARFATARTTRLNARACATCYPGDATWKLRASEADRMVREYALPIGTMPR